ncbi:MAG: hypothetical protein BZ136_00985 [Methanosphaera sp. rholeuAM74]|nr:MAG: hypothetical protein BZ136_00985 [Methanosphaera sp. rholeuAM74]
MIILRPTNKNIELYPIGSPKGALNTKRTPKFIGKFRLKNNNNHIEADKFTVEKNGKKQQQDTKTLEEILKKQNIIITKKDKNLIKYLKHHNINYKRIPICNDCINKEKVVKLLDKKHDYTYYKAHLCKSCANTELKKVQKEYDINDVVLSKIKKTVDNPQDIAEIIDFIETQEDQLQSEDFTLYDKIEYNEERFAEVSIEDLEIPNIFKSILRRKVEYLLPTQILAVNAGLLYNENLLIVSATASGKTLIGELAGIPKALNKKKFLYLSPIVALANQKYRTFKETYNPLGLNVVIKVGSNRINADEELVIPDVSTDDADIIVATYEGLDFILRSGNVSSLGDVGVVIIDEIHMLESPERGHRLNGLINRLSILYPTAQLIGLSATIDNADEIADYFNMKLVSYDKRPVALERHLLQTANEKTKRDTEVELAKREFENVSDKGYKGQTIIFTNSRRYTEVISNDLNNRGVSAASYHSGLTYSKKVHIEEEYAKQNISTIVTTAALAAGVDMPASLVIFDTLRMGREWLSVNEFYQMIGRAGRPSFHDKGTVYLLPESDKKFDFVSENQMALELLDADVARVDVDFDYSGLLEEVLSDFSAVEDADVDVLKSNYDSMDTDLTYEQVLDELVDYDLLDYDEQSDTYNVTRYGRSVSMSFLNINHAEYIRNHLHDDAIDIVSVIEPITNVYLPSNVLGKLAVKLKRNLSTLLFSDSVKMMLESGELVLNLDYATKKKYLKLQADFFVCDCEDYPYCKCLERNISKDIINKRLSGMSPLEISRYYKENYELSIYAGDIFNWLDQVLRILEGVERICDSFDYSAGKMRAGKLVIELEEGQIISDEEYMNLEVEE